MAVPSLDINPGLAAVRVSGAWESEGLVPVTQLRLLLNPGSHRSQAVK